MNATSQPRQHDELVQKLTQIVLDNIENEQFGVSELAEQIGMNRSHLYRKIKILTKKSLSQFIREIRLNEALNLLKDEKVTVSEAAYRVGFNNPSYFNSCFHDHYGFPPGEAKQKNLENTLRYKKSEESPVKHRFSSPKKYVYMAIFFFLVIVSMATVFILKRDKYPEEKISIAILPFENLSSDIENQYFADGVVEDLQFRLSKINDLKLISRTSSEMFREKGDKTVSEIAALLGVKYILEGTVRKEGENIRISVRLIDTQVNDPVYSQQYNGNISEVFKMQGQIAEQIAIELSLFLTDHQIAELQRNLTDNPRALELYQMGRFHWNKRTVEGIMKSIDYCEQAIGQDPGFGLAYAGLASANLLLGSKFWGRDADKYRDKAVELALKALELDPELSEPHALLGSVYFNLDWAWEKAEGEFILALKLNPTHSTTRLWYSEYLYLTQRTEEADEQIKKAVELDPYSFIIRHEYISSLIRKGFFEDALVEIHKCRELHNEHTWLCRREFTCYYELGKEQEALESLIKLKKLEDPLFADTIYRNAGLEGSIYLKIEESPTLYGKARWHSLLGNEDKALDLLEELLYGNQIHTAWWVMRYEFIRIHDHPRFRAILREMGLEPYFSP